MATDRALGANAETAQELAPALLKFQTHVPEAATEVSALVSELYAISAALLELKTASNEQRNFRNRKSVDQDKYVVLQSLEYTFKDINHFIRATDNRTYRSDREAFKDVWIQIDTHFRNESNNSLLARLGYYKQFIDGLTPIVHGRPASPDVDYLYDRISELLGVQDERLRQDLEDLALGTPRVRSFERVRDHGAVAPREPPGTGPARRGDGEPRGGVGAGGPGGPGGRAGFQSPRSPLFGESPPYVPDPPLHSPSSPSVTASTATATSASTPPSSAEPSMYNHWLPMVFKQSRPTTGFHSTGTESRCHGEHMTGAVKKLKEQYIELLRVPFEPGQMEVRLYYREEDRKARILWREDRGNRKASCQVVKNLRIYRRDSCLQLCLPGGRRRSWEVWATLRFPSYERLVLFFCCLLALKAQDESDPIRKLDDHILEGESTPFSAVIIDDNYQHALQIFKDAGSEGIRLQASVLRGPLKRTPIWTAFINYKIPAKKWAHLAEPRKVHIVDLQRYIFVQDEDYSPQLGPKGEHELFFAERADAQKFLEVVEDLAEGRIL